MVPLVCIVLLGSSQEEGEDEFQGPHHTGNRQCEHRGAEATSTQPCWEDPIPKAGPLPSSQGTRVREGRRRERKES